MDLAGPVLTEAVSQQSVPWLRAICFGKRELVPALYTMLSVTVTKIISTLASLLQGAWHPGHTQSALLCAVTTPHKRHVPAGPVARAPLPSPRARRYFPLCSARWSSNASRRPAAPSWSAQHSPKF